MPEEERLSLVSDVEDEFTEELVSLQGLLEDVDDAIRDTGRGRDYVRIDVEADISDAVTELSALEAGMDAIDEDVTVGVNTDVDDVDGSVADEAMGVGDGGGRAGAVGDGGSGSSLFGVDNMDDWARELGPYLDTDTLVERGGETSRLTDVLDRDLEEVVDLDRLVSHARDPDSSITGDTIRNLTTGGVDDAMGALDTITGEDDSLTLLGDDGGSKQFRRLRKSVMDLRFTMGTFHQIIASMLPVLGVFVGALPAAIVGVGALATAAFGAAAALAGIAGIGAIGMMMTESGGLNSQPLLKRLREVGSEYLDAFAPLADSFTPVLRDAITQIEMMAGPLADATAGLLAFREEFAAVTGFITGALPSFTQDILGFTHAAAPLLSSLVATISNVDFLGYFAAQLSMALPELWAIGSAFMEILPALVAVSQGFLTIAAVITGVISGFAWLVNTVPFLGEAFGVLAGAIITVVAASTMYSIVSSAMGSTILSSVIPALNAKIASLLGVASASWTAYGATAALLGLLSFGLIPVISSLGSMFGGAGGKIADARKELEKFANGKNALNEGIPTDGQTPTSRASNVYRDNSTTIIDASSQDDAARQQYSNQYERQQHVDSVFGG